MKKKINRISFWNSVFLIFIGLCFILAGCSFTRYAKSPNAIPDNTDHKIIHDFKLPDSSTNLNFALPYCDTIFPSKKDYLQGKKIGSICELLQKEKEYDEKGKKYSNVTVRFFRFESIQSATDNFWTFTLESLGGMDNLTTVGNIPNRYCISKKIECRAGSASFFMPMGQYISNITIQRGNILIVIDERTNMKYSNRKNEILNQLYAQINASINN
jgi:hypothetical protein